MAAAKLFSRREYAISWCLEIPHSISAVYTTGGEQCAFPFTYSGVTYYGCTTVDHDVPWCSPNPVYNGVWDVRDSCDLTRADMNTIGRLLQWCCFDRGVICESMTMATGNVMDKNNLIFFPVKTPNVLT